jgi:Zn-dependent peptidase ImmA (M78 family)
MGLRHRAVQQPEIALAQRIIEKYHLSPCIDILEVARIFAEVEVVNIPFDVDGMSINLKTHGKKPKILINSSRSWKRRRFTVAHEIGHVVIPWHMGSFFDSDVENQADNEPDPYIDMEHEADRFASELLMPSDWVAAIIKNKDNMEELVNIIFNEADVSAQAATIKAINELPSGFMCAEIGHNDLVVWAGRSTGTLANAPVRGSQLNRQRLSQFVAEQWEFELSGRAYLWLKVTNTADSRVEDDGVSWREVLDLILVDLRIDTPDEIKTIKQQINGVFSYANSNCKRSGQYNVESLMASALQRFFSVDYLKGFQNHEKFMLFLRKRVADQMSKFKGD